MLISIDFDEQYQFVLLNSRISYGNGTDFQKINAQEKSERKLFSSLFNILYEFTGTF